MRRFLLIIALVCCSARVDAAITAVGTPAGVFTGTGTTSNTSYTPAATNNLLVVSCVIGVGTATNCTIADTQSVSFVQMNAFVALATSGISGRSWVGLTTNTNADSITVTAVGTGANPGVGITVEEFSGTATSSIVDQVAASPDNQSGNVTTPNITPGTANDLIWAFVAGTTTSTGNIGGVAATAGANDGNGDITEFRILVGGAGVAINATFNNTGNYLAFIGSVKPASGATPCQSRLSLLGVSTCGE